MADASADKGRFRGNRVGEPRTVVAVTDERKGYEELAPMAALAGAIAAAAEAGRYAGGGMRTMGRRFAQTELSRRALAGAVESRRRTNLAYQILRGLEVPVEPRPTRRPATYVAWGVVVGTTGAAAMEALRRALANDAGGRLTTRVRGLAKGSRQAVTPAETKAEGASAEATAPEGTAVDDPSVQRGQ
jgi:sugar phosphate isomerase/epimerase